MAGRRRKNGATDDALDLVQRRLALVIEATGAGVYDHFVPLDGGGFHSDRWAAILGYTVDELPPKEGILAWLHDRVHPDDLPRLRRSYDDFVEGRISEYAVEVRIRRKSGEWIWVKDLSRAAARDADGRVTRVVGVMLDITERTRRERERGELLERERAARLQAERARERYRSVTEGLGCVVFEADPRDEMCFTLVNGTAAEKLLGYPVARWSEPGFWLREVVHPDDRERVEWVFKNAAGRDHQADDEFRSLAADGREIWLRCLLRHDVDERGRVLRVRGIMVDVTRRRRLQDRERLLMAEVDHRAKNMLAAMQSMVVQTQLTATSVDEFAETLTGRIHALSRAQELLARAKWQGTPVRDVLAEALDAFTGSDAVTVQGDDVALPPNAVQALTLALHELATNAVRHGALSQPSGRVTVTSTVGRSADNRETLRLRWEETGGPEVAPPERRGFGSRLIEHGLAYEANGAARLEFAPEGLRCYIEIPL